MFAFLCSWKSVLKIKSTCIYIYLKVVRTPVKKAHIHKEKVNIIIQKYIKSKKPQLNYLRKKSSRDISRKRYTAQNTERKALNVVMRLTIYWPCWKDFFIYSKNKLIFGTWQKWWSEKSPHHPSICQMESNQFLIFIHDFCIKNYSTLSRFMALKIADL